MQKRITLLIMVIILILITGCMKFDKTKKWNTTSDLITNEKIVSIIEKNDGVEIVALNNKLKTIEIKLSKDTEIIENPKTLKIKKDNIVAISKIGKTFDINEKIVFLKNLTKTDLKITALNFKNENLGIVTKSVNYVDYVNPKYTTYYPNSNQLMTLHFQNVKDLLNIEIEIDYPASSMELQTDLGANGVVFQNELKDKKDNFDVKTEDGKVIIKQIGYSYITELNEPIQLSFKFNDPATETLTISATFLDQNANIYNKKNEFKIKILNMAGDINNDNIVNIYDFIEFANAYGSNESSETYNKKMDIGSAIDENEDNIYETINADGTIDATDFSIFSDNYGLTVNNIKPKVWIKTIPKINTSRKLDFEWNGIDFNNDRVEYDVWFGKPDELTKIGTRMETTKISSSIIMDLYNSEYLNYKTQYRLKIDAIDYRDSTVTYNYDFITVDIPPTSTLLSPFGTNIRLLPKFEFNFDYDDENRITKKFFLEETKSGERTIITLNSTQINLNFFLKPGNEYKWWIETTDEYGTTNKSTESTILTTHSPLIEIKEPAENENNVRIKSLLTWVATDIDNDPMHFDIYLKDDDFDIINEKNHNEQEFETGILEYGKTYYWKITANDDKDASTTTNYSTFTVVNETQLMNIISTKFEIADILDNATPITIYSTDLTDSINDVEKIIKDNETIYIPLKTGDIKIIDITNPLDPDIKTVKIGKELNDLEVYNNNLYLGTENGIYIYSTQESTIISKYTEFYINDIEITNSGSIIIATKENIILGEIKNDSFIEETEISKITHNMQLYGDSLYFTANQEFIEYNLTDESSKIYNIGTLAFGKDFVIENNNAYVVFLLKGIKIINLDTFEEENEIELSDPIKYIEKNGNCLYIPINTPTNYSIKKINLENLTNPIITDIDFSNPKNLLITDWSVN
ncbi:hypothetical protein X275_00705 [Marinitoga sp. 1197]|uniref:hypothetical protein n=1 Tax=Marinitoga sp. 1197 TaxID=1428449 RepID=UPI000641362F|nr:hypothetical protein [Marinitoga sp. 1197]KLO24237.1 hypothetical protein X275_00705 [Marinitoga sp. 1197]